MSLEARLRQGLHAAADPMTVDVEEAFATVVTQSRRRRRTHRALGTAAAVAAAAAAVLVVGGDRTPPATPAQDVTVPTTGPAGRYVAQIGATAGDDTSALAGRWTMNLGTDGTLTLGAPATFTARTDGAIYAIAGHELRTDLFVNDLCQDAQATRPVGVYRWSRSGNQLTLTPVADACRTRAALLAGHPWQVTP